MRVLIDRFKLIKIKLCQVKISVMRVGSSAPATSKMGIFVTIVKKWKLSKIVKIAPS